MPLTTPSTTTSTKTTTTAETSIRFNFRRSNITKFGLLVILMTFCAMKVLIVSDLTEWNEDTPRDVSRYILPSENTSLLFPRIYPDNDNKQLDFLLVVTSDPRHFDRRVAIRQTWGAVKNWEPQVKMSIIFLMGLSLQPQVNQNVEEESRMYGDILLENFNESYNNLTIKSLMMLKFISISEVKSELIFKIDDDTFLNVPRLLELYKSSKLSNQISGMILRERSPIRWASRFDEKHSNWIVPKWMFPEDRYPLYIAGLGYIFPTWMAKCLLKTALATPLVHIEDVYVTGILAEKCAFPKGDIPGIYKTSVDPCNPANDIVLLHNIRPEEQEFLQDVVTKKSKRKCSWTP